jgi:hypothetical protein
MAFKWYNHFSIPLRISLMPYGFTLSSSSYEAIGNPDYIEVGYDQDEKLVALKASDSKGYKVTIGKRNSYYRINCKTAVVAMGIKDKWKCIKLSPWVEGDVLIARLSM